MGGPVLQVLQMLRQPSTASEALATPGGKEDLPQQYQPLGPKRLSFLKPNSAQHLRKQNSENGWVFLLIHQITVSPFRLTFGIF